MCVAAVPERDTSGRPHQARDAGFSLVEMMVALAVFAVLGTSVGVLVVDSLRTTRADQSRVRAASLTAQEIEAVRAGLRSGGGIGNTGTLSFPWGDPACAVSSPTCVRFLDGEKFTLTRAVVPVAADATHAGRLQVTVSATWPAMAGVRPVVNSTVMTARGIDPAAAGSDTPGGGTGSVGVGTSAVSVAVTGAGGAPAANIPVTLTLAGGTGVLVNTDSSGVALFTAIPAATYTVSATQAGYIDVLGNPTATASVTTAANTTSTVALKYAQAGTVTYTVSVPATYTAPASAFLIGTYNGDLLTTRTVTPSSGTGSTQVQTWPAGSVKAWTGTCDTDRPATGFSLAAGGTATKAVDLGGLQVTVSKSLIGLFGALLSTPINGAQVVAVKTADPGCPGTAVDPTTGGAAGAVVSLGTTNSSGVVKAALPPGTWTVKVVGYSLGLTGGLAGWPQVTVSDSGVNRTKSLSVNMGLL